jgi:hypothetical protein
MYTYGSNIVLIFRFLLPSLDSNCTVWWRSCLLALETDELLGPVLFPMMDSKTELMLFMRSREFYTQSLKTAGIGSLIVCSKIQLLKTS